MALFSRKSPGRPRPAPPVPGSSGAARSDADARIREIGAEMLDRARRHSAGLLSAKFYSEKLMEWSMKDHDFKVQMFRFVDAFPVLTTPEMIHDHLTDYLTQPGVRVPAALELGLKAGGVAKGLMASTISGQIRSMAAKFIAGTDAASALPVLKGLWKDGIAFSVDLLGEACVSDAEAAAYAEKYLDLITNLPGQVGSWPSSERLERDQLGAIPRTNVSIKISSLSARCDPIDTEGSIRSLMKAIVPLLEAARDRGVLINFDMEQASLKDLTLELFMRCCEAVDFQAGLAMQASPLRPDDAGRLAGWAHRHRQYGWSRGAGTLGQFMHQLSGRAQCGRVKWKPGAEEMTEILLDATRASGAPAKPSGGCTLQASVLRRLKRWEGDRLRGQS